MDTVPASENQKPSHTKEESFHVESSAMADTVAQAKPLF